MPAFTDASVTLVIGIVKKFFMMIGFSGASLSICTDAVEDPWLSSSTVMVKSSSISMLVAAEMQHCNQSIK